MKKRKLKRVVIYALLILSLIYVLFPFFWMVSTSFKLPTEWVTRPPVWISEKPTLNNYLLILNPLAIPAEMRARVESEWGYTMGTAIKPIINSTIIAGAATLLAVLVGYMAAYSISRYGTGGNFMYLFVLLTRMFPPIACAIPILVMFSSLRLVDTHFALIILYTGFSVAFVIWMMKGFIDEVPREIEEAAKIDGYSDWQIVWRITAPLVAGGLAASALLVFILNWCEFLFALIFTHTEAITIPVYLMIISQAIHGMLYGPMTALSTIAVIPTIIFGYIIQRHLVRGLTFGAVRGR